MGNESSGAVITLLGIALWAVLPGYIAEGKGRSFWGFYFLSFLISPLVTTIIALCLSKEKKVFVPVTPPQHETQVPPDAAWKCSCGRYHPKYVSSCVCGRSRSDNAKATTGNTAAAQKSCFCRKCGSKLLGDSQFCDKCGTKVEKEG